LIFAHPKLVAAGQRVDAPVSPVDIAPTILDILGRPPLPQAQGVSLAPYIRRVAKAANRPSRSLFAELGPLGVSWEGQSHQKAIRNERYKLIVTYGEMSKQLFDWIDDPREKKDLYEAKKDTAEIRELESQLDEFIRAGIAYNAAFREKNEIQIDEKTRERLRALGYMD
jgi:arylsulfatase A-like enzyme